MKVFRPTRGKKGIKIFKDLSTFREKPKQHPTTCGKGKGKGKAPAPTILAARYDVTPCMSHDLY